MTPDMKVTVLEKIVEKFVPHFAWKFAKPGIQSAQNKIIAYCLKPEHITAKWIDKPAKKSKE